MARHDIVAIGGSLGAVDAVRQLCRGLPADIAASIAIVVHVGARGHDLLAGIINESVHFAVRTAADGERLEHGHAYVAPADHHLLIIGDTIRLGRGPRENMARPAVDPLFRSVGISRGSRAIGVVLTGMLNDGAAGLADLKRCGGVTVVQNPADAQAPDMPLGALRASDVDYRAPLADLPGLLVELLTQDAGPPVAIPDDIRTEVDIALGRAASENVLRKIADPVPLSCPTCGGVLSQIKRGSPLRFRCQVGHGFTADAIDADGENVVEEAMQLARRIIGEKVVLNEKMAEDARQNGYPGVAAINDRRAEDYRRYAEVLRKVLATGV